MLHVPNVCVTSSLDLLFGLAHGGAEAVVYLLVDTIACFIPDKVWNRIDGGVEELVGLPEIGLALSVCLPFLEMKSEQRIVKRRFPEIKEETCCFIELGEGFSGSYQDDIGTVFALRCDVVYELRCFRSVRSYENEVGFTDRASIDALTCMNAMLEVEKRLDVRDERDAVLRKPYNPIR